jgi:hypothetical protein
MTYGLFKSAFIGVLADYLRDRLVCGMRHENIQKKLLSEAGLTLKKASTAT